MPQNFAAGIGTEEAKAGFLLEHGCKVRRIVVQKA